MRWLAFPRDERCLACPPSLLSYGSKMKACEAGGMSVNSEGVGSWPRRCQALSQAWGGAWAGHATALHLSHMIQDGSQQIRMMNNNGNM